MYDGKTIPRKKGGGLVSKVLIIDDAYFMRNLIKKALREAGYEVVGEAINGTEGLRLYKELNPDFVTMDIKMPDISGVEVTRQIISEYPNAKIIVVTGNNDESIKKEILKAGAMDYLRKPFQPAFLLTKVEGMLQEEPETVGLKETASSIVEPIQIEVKVDDDMEDDFFNEATSEKAIALEKKAEEPDEVEVFDLLDKPDEEKQAILLIENEEDLIEFPDNFDAEEDAEQHVLSEENLKRWSDETEEVGQLEEDFVHKETSSIIPHDIPTQSPSKMKAIDQLESAVELADDALSNEEEETPISIPSFPKDEKMEIDSPIRIRPPRGRDKVESKEDDDYDNGIQDFLIDSTSEQIVMTPEKKNGVMKFFKKIFKP